MLASWSNQPATLTGEARAANTTFALSPAHLLCAAVDAGIGRRVLACRCAVIRERRRRPLCLSLEQELSSVNQRQLCRGVDIEWHVTLMRKRAVPTALHALCHAADAVGNSRTPGLVTAQEFAWCTAAGTSRVTYIVADQAGRLTRASEYAF